MPVQIQFRRGLASEWTAANPTLAAGEMGLETDTLKFKIGDGTTVWNSLAYATQGAAGEGVPVGGTTNQVLAKVSATNYDTAWVASMLPAVYDPNTVAGDAFDMDNMVEGTDTKILTAAERTKLGAIEAGADVTDAGNVGSAINGATAKTTPVDADTVGLIDSAASNALKKLSWANIKATLKTYFDTLYSAVTHTHVAANITDFDTEVANNTTVAANTSKLSGIEAGADVTDTANVTAAGALMDSEVDPDIKTLSLPASTTISTFGKSLVDDADAAAARATLGTAKITVSATEPSSPSTNDLWVDIS